MAGISAPTIDLDQQGLTSKSPYQSQIQKLEMQLKDLQIRYGPNYPDVRKLRSDVNQLKAKAEAEKTQDAVPDPPPSVPKRQIHNPVVEAEMNKLDQDIAEQVKVQADLQNQIQYHVGKLQQVPIFEQQIAGLMRDYDSLKNHYNQLQEKKLAAEMAGELEKNQAGERFEIIDKAVPPEAPFGPRRGLMMIGGVFLGLMCGAAAAFIAEISDESVRHEREAAQIFGKPVLAGIPRIVSHRELMLGRWRIASMTAGTAVAAAVLGLVISRFVS
jgi:uncharacterized protein involved in exopolysaccharide biosynthesis